MKKEKGKEIKFNPADYSHLNAHLPFQEWIAEILSRNETFRTDHEAFLQLQDHQKIEKYRKYLFKKYKVHVLALPTLSGKIRIAIPPTINESRITNRQDLTPEQMEYVGCTLDEILSEKIRVDLNLYPDTLLLTINLNRPKEVIEAEIKKILGGHKKRKLGNLRLDKWKYHIIVYDLNKAGYTHDDIGNTLQSTFVKEDDPTDCFSPETIKKYVREGKNLIEKLGYLKYL